MNEQELDLTFDIGYHMDTASLRLIGSLSLHTSTLFKSKVARLIDAKIKALILDVSDITHMDTGGLIALMTVSKICSGKGMSFAVSGHNQIVEKILESSGLTHLLSANRDAHAALQRN